MKKDRIYIDTSIVGGYFDIEFEFETKLLFERLENKEIIFVVSDLMDIELERAPERVKNLLFNYPKECFERVSLTKEAQELGQMYVNEKVVGQTSIEDCYHIAMATINNVDVLASWNFRHIVNFTRIKGYNSVNLKSGYNLLEIRNPKDLIEYGNE
ncbi:MAG: PIN domain protein [Flavobacteriaceae bacterium CG18_big_fil_WC_8_21_14_2_50_34_36]|nr:MAG: PIN domain protein [Flavobacteriaceae bacterium CG18_big_fil_WC_8_21_14_2_50_34_36]PIV51772.1 MAG: PIN domain protein [Flavobacteriaceae bacterium CG02_land_8_20_14_3_00_34_13]